MMILRVTKAKIVGQYSLALTFNDGMCKTVDVGPLLVGPIFEPLRNPDYFSLGSLDFECGTVVWPNGADFAPEALYDLEPAGSTGETR